ncbi:hypothetical protein LNAT_P0325 [Lebetimonas natsushimae]|uniref:Uncharacterized protein n=1 Tax=Lebetimonas natsushimae TaxID=1936991 RepID=A0A292YCB3_9BACT|nr:hypothetical protein [Lebetimonas natsushimae]GAX87030.1 hypothetical protein LNAT_P0325 [Lebetimonas natsushimae]
MKEKQIDSIAFVIIKKMLSYYVDNYIAVGKEFMKNNFSKDTYNETNLIFNEIKHITEEILTYIEHPDNKFINTRSVYYFFTVLRPAIPKEIEKSNNQNTFYAYNNPYYLRNTPCIKLDEQMFQELFGEMSLKKLEDKLEKNFSEDISLYCNYIGIIHLMEIFIRSVFFFAFNKHLKDKEKETLLNIFVWMISNSYQNFFSLKKGSYYKNEIAYYYREFINFQFFSGKKFIKSYKDYSNMIRPNLHKYYKNSVKITTKLSDNEKECKTIGILPSNIPSNRQIDEQNIEYLLAPPFYLSTGKGKDSLVNRDFVYVSIGTYTKENKHSPFTDKIILTYSYI